MEEVSATEDDNDASPLGSLQKGTIDLTGVTVGQHAYIHIGVFVSHTKRLYQDQEWFIVRLSVVFCCYYNLHITGWAVALTCCISHSAKYRKMADFDPSGSRNPLTNFDETWHG